MKFSVVCCDEHFCCSHRRSRCYDLKMGSFTSVDRVIIIIIIIIIIVSFMQGICTYIPETNNVPREYTVATVLLLLFMVPISLVSALALLCFYVSTFWSMCAVPNVAVFCSSLTSWFYYYYYYCLLKFGCHPVAVVSLHVYKIWNWWLLNLGWEGYMRSM
jgi:hypothetical protein